MRFENPAWLWLLAILPLISLLFLAGERRAAYRIKQMAAPRLLHSLSTGARWPRVLRHLLSLLATGLIIVALARPSYGYNLREIHGKGANILFAIDVSRSMLCADITPNRLTRAKLAVQDMLEAAPGHRAGLIPFSREAFLQCPLTLDATALRQSLEATNTSSVPTGGTSLADAIAEARKAFGTDEGRKVLVILSDGEDLEGAGLKEARASEGMTIITIGTGTPEGAPVPLSAEGGSDYTRDASGRLVSSKLDSGALEAISQATDGFYAPVNSGMLVSKFTSILDDEGPASKEATSLRMPISRYRWPLAAALTLLIIEALIPALRRKNGNAAALLLALLIPLSPNNSRAADLPIAPATSAADDAPDASKEIVPGNPRESYNQGVALYRKGEYAAAAEAFDKALKQNTDASGPLMEQATGNAGIARLAQALEAMPEDEEAPIPAEQKTALKKQFEEAKKQIETAMSLRPEDENLRNSFKRSVDAIKQLDKPETIKKQPPQDKQKDQQDKQDQQKKDDQQDGDKSSQGQQGQDSSGQGQQDQQDQQQNPQDSQSQNGGQSGQQQQQDQSQQQQGQDSSGQGQQDQQDQQQNPQDSQSQNGGQSGQQQQQQSQKEGQKPEEQQDKGQSGNQPQSQKSDEKAQEQEKQQEQQEEKDKQDSQGKTGGQSAQQQEQKPAEKPEDQDKQGQSGDGQSEEQKDSEKPEEQKAQQQSSGGQSQQDKQELQTPKEQPEQQQGDDSSGQKEDQEAPKPDEKQDSAGKGQSAEQEKREQEKQQQDKAGESAGEQKDAEQQQQLSDQQQKSAAEQKQDDAEEEKQKQAQAAEEKEAAQAKEGEQSSDMDRDGMSVSEGGDSDQKDESRKTARMDRREGEDTSDLEPSGTAKVQQPAETASPTPQPQADGSMSKEEAEQLLRLLRQDEKLLPAGELVEPHKWNSSGRDW